MALSGTRRATRRRVPSPGRGARAAEVLHSTGAVALAPEAMTKAERSVGGQSRRHFPPRAEAAAAAPKAGRASIRTVPAEPAPAGSHGATAGYWESRRVDRRRPERTHVHGPSDGNQLDDSAALTRSLGAKGKPVLPDGTVARFRPAEELSLERRLTRRRKIDPADKATQRNGIGEAKPGDNLVARADYTPGFYVGGAGAVPGSTSGLHKPYDPLPRPKGRAGAAAESRSAVRAYGADSPPPPVPSSFGGMSLEQRRRAEALVADMEAIESLCPDEASSDEDEDGDGAEGAPRGPATTWEGLTGNYTVAPRVTVAGEAGGEGEA